MLVSEENAYPKGKRCILDVVFNEKEGKDVVDEEGILRGVAWADLVWELVQLKIRVIKWAVKQLSPVTILGEWVNEWVMHLRLS